MRVSRALPIIAMIVLSGCTQNVEASDPQAIAEEYRPLESDLTEVPRADGGAEAEKPTMRSPVAYD